MVFSSLTFLFFFFPLVFLLNAVLPSIRAKNVLLLISSLLFYAWGEPIYVFLMVLSVLINWVLSLFIAKRQEGGKLLVFFTVLVNIGLLVVFKYSAFLVEGINLIPGISLPVPQIRLPIGISFFTFQAMSYVIDVYRDRSTVQRRFMPLLLYVSFFPQLIAGPIVKYHDIAAELNHRTVTPDQTARGLCRFMFGLGKKVLLANTLAAVTDNVFALPAAELTAAAAWIGAIGYALQIYFDFSGYSDMAIGLGWIFGFHFKENFNYPYAALGIKDFWRRWHISLSTWFKEYLYIPLGGNRKGRARTLLNQLIVFTATGLWHGANVTFLVWGLFHGLFLVLESVGILPMQKLAKRPVLRPFVRLYTVFLAVIAFVVFRADSIGYALSFIGSMFVGGGGIGAELLTMLTPWFWCMLAVACVASFPLAPTLRTVFGRTKRAATVGAGLRYAASLGLFALCLLSLAADTYNPFIYFRF